MLNTDTAARIAETVRKAFPFEVEKKRLHDPEGRPTRTFGLFRSDNNHQVGNAVSERYEPHTTDDVLALTEAAAHGFDDKIVVRCHWDNGQHVSIQPTNAERVSLFNGRDSVWPRYLLKGQYNGLHIASAAMFRDLCSNMAELKQVEGTTTSIRHTAGPRLKMNGLIESFQELKSSWITMGEAIRNMEARKVRMIDFLNEIYPQPEADASQRSVTIHSDRTKLIFDRLQSEHSRLGLGLVKDNSSVSAWLAFNAVQGYVQHEKSRNNLKDLNRDIRFDRMLLANNDPVVRKAEMLTLTMAS